MSMTKKSRRRLFAVYGGLSVIGLILANAFPGLFEHVEVVPVNAWFIAPFAVLLLSIAVAPFIDKHWWEKNYDSVAYVLGFIVVQASNGQEALEYPRRVARLLRELLRK